MSPENHPNTRTRFISFSVTEERKREIEVFCERKKRWKDSSALARDAVYQLMARYPIYRKKGEKDEE